MCGWARVLKYGNLTKASIRGNREIHVDGLKHTVAEDKERWILQKRTEHNGILPNPDQLTELTPHAALKNGAKTA